MHTQFLIMQEDGAHTVDWLVQHQAPSWSEVWCLWKYQKKSDDCES